MSARLPGFQQARLVDCARVQPTRVLAPEITHAGVEQVPPHSAQLVQQVAARDVVGVPKTLRLQALEVGIKVKKKKKARFFLRNGWKKNNLWN